MSGTHGTERIRQYVKNAKWTEEKGPLVGDVEPAGVSRGAINAIKGGPGATPVVCLPQGSPSPALANPVPVAMLTMAAGQAACAVQAS